MAQRHNGTRDNSLTTNTIPTEPTHKNGRTAQQLEVHGGEGSE